jgi:hypothetical protein
MTFDISKITNGLFTRPISEHDFAITYYILESKNLLCVLKNCRLNAKSDASVNRP